MLFDKPKREINRVFIHCSASDNYKHDDISIIKQWHLERGWRDVGYHYFITKLGKIQKGRDLELTPAAQKGYNTGTIAICVSGLKIFSHNSLKSLKMLCQIINRQYDQITFHGHCEVSEKECPVFDYKRILNLSIKNIKKGEML